MKSIVQIGLRLPWVAVPAALAILAAVACTSTNVIELGENHYSVVSTSQIAGPDAARLQARQKAAELCRSQGKDTKVVNQNWRYQGTTWVEDLEVRCE